MPESASLPSVLRLVAEQARRTPDVPAVLDGDRAVSYRELVAAAERLAAVLAERGVGRGATVGMCVARGAALPVAILGILGRGAAYLPLDAGYPAERLSFMLRDSGAPVVLTGGGLLDPGTVPPGVVVVDLDAIPDGADTIGLAEVHPAELAYVMYTSGSTGRPKGVGMPHDAMANLIDWQRRTSACGAGARTLQFSAASFDASFQEIFSTWAAGGTLVMIDEATRRDATRLLAFIRRHRVERLFLPFVALQALALAARDAEPPDTLREVITAGEQLLVTAAVRDLFRAAPRAVLVNQYGPSETHIVTALDLGRTPDRWPDIPTIGSPIDGSTVDVRDPDGERLPPGEVGEICIGGVVLARGYHGRPRLTAERFRPDPAGPPGSRSYRSGDLGRIEADGTVRWLGRSDGQVKIRGHRIELDEVEGALKALPGVRDGVVVAAGTAGERRLIGYAITDAGVAAQAPAALRETLPEYAVPFVVVALDTFPLTPSGKVDRLALSRRPVVVGAATTGGPERPAGAGVAGLIALWEDVLGVEGIGPDDPFLDVGGTSLLGAVLLTRLNDRFDVRADLDVLARHGTPAELHDWLTARETAGSGGPR